VSAVIEPEGGGSMRGAVVAATAACAMVVVASVPVRADEAEGSSHRGLFERYCSGCHGLDDRPSRNEAPHLSGLTARYRSPLPMARLTDFVLSVHRPGGQRICGERVFSRLPFTPFNDYAEREIVRAALQYVAAGQAAEPPGGRR
jgi:hypothetical protein